MLPPYWQFPEITEIGREPMLGLEPSRCLSLDGEWRFQLLDHPTAEPAPSWSTAPVPSLWTMQGTWDLPQYTNVRMPFPELPPSTPQLNPTGIYERDLEIPQAWMGDRIVISIGGFESLLIVSVNGTEIGLAKDGRLAADFDISRHVRAGHNVLRLRVVKWSDSSFIEDQDEWWHGGITRSVVLFRTPRTHIERMYLTPGFDLEAGQGTLRVRTKLAFAHGVAAAGLRLQVLLPGDDISLEHTFPVEHMKQHTDFTPEQAAVASAFFLGEYANADIPADVLMQLRTLEPLPIGEIDVTLAIPDVSPWSAESPSLHDVQINLLQPDGTVVESFHRRIGFRDVRIIGRQLLVNGQPVLLYGVNRHDFHPRTGRVLTSEDIRADLLELKRWNVNAIRTSHYPNDPALLEMADELGFYVVDEANIESHAYYQAICDDPRYLNAFVARVSRMAQRDVQHASVILWSLGNESGYGANHDAAAGWLRHFDPTRPLHYEGAIRGDWRRGHTATDVVCPMYPSIQAIVRHATSGAQDRPLIMCEYSHAMGNSNGSLRDYWDAIEQHEGLQGGFIWEMWDHGLEQRLPDGRMRHAYGGDFDEIVHDGNFCCDGVFFPDRTAKPAMHEFLQIAAPVSIEDLGSGLLRVTNRRWFVDAGDLELEWDALRADGSRQRACQALPGIAPRTSVEVDLGITDAVFTTCAVRVREASPWAPAHHEVGWAQFGDTSLAATLTARNIGAADTPDDRERRLLADVVMNARLSLWRAPTDNDRIGGLASRWEQQGLRHLSVVHEQVDGAMLRRTLATGDGTRLQHERKVTATAAGFAVEERVTIPPELSDLARVGIEFRIPDADEVTWFGAGPHETYPDRALARDGLWQLDIGAMHTDYIRPQENGARQRVHWLQVQSPAGSWRITNHEPRHMSLSHFTDAMLADSTHNADLVPERDVIIHLDAAHRGVGSASCGPDTLSQYRVSPGTYVWSWRFEHVTAPV